MDGKPAKGVRQQRGRGREGKAWEGAVPAEGKGGGDDPKGGAPGLGRARVDAGGPRRKAASVFRPNSVQAQQSTQLLTLPHSSFRSIDSNQFLFSWTF